MQQRYSGTGSERNRQQVDFALFNSHFIYNNSEQLG